MTTRNDLAHDLTPLLLTGNNEKIGYTDVLKIAESLLAAGYRKPRVVDSAEELDALPNKAVVRTVWGSIWERVKDRDGVRDYWNQPGSLRRGAPALPALVLYVPEES